MAPTKSTTNNNHSQQVVMSNLLPLARKGLTRQSKQQQSGAFNQDQNIIMSTMQTRGKRKAEASPMKNEKIKRSALGNLTNNVKVMSLQSAGGQQGQGSKDDAVKQLKAMVKKAMHNVIDNNNSNSKDNNSNSKDNNLYGGTQQQILQQIQLLQDTQNIGGGSAAAATATKHKITTRATSKQATTTSKTTIDVESSKLIAKTKDTKETQQQNSHQHRHNQAIGPPAAPIAPHNAVPVVKSQTKPVRRISNEFNKTEESLYMSALDFSSSESMRLSGNFEAARRRSQLLQQKEKTDDEQTEMMSTEEAEAKNVSLAKIEEHVEGASSIPETKLAEILKTAVPKIPEGVDDFDKANWNDPFQVSHYAMDIFQYLKEREKDFVIGDYMEKQIHLSKWMRSLLVDWMVEVQETFELNHETLYLAVKIVDLYLCRVVIYKDKLQLLGAAALFIACKFDERTPPLIEDFLYICDGAYKQDELLKMEMHTLRTIDYDLGIPLSYRFLRRYARCAKVPMPTLTLARYILELSLMDYATISASDSQLAAAAMFMALRLHGELKGWTPTLEYYSGYKLADFADWVPVLNAGLHRKPKGTIKTIRSKYSHKIFHEVAKVQLLTTEQLFEHNLDLNVSMKEEKAAATEQQQGKGSSNST